MNGELLFISAQPAHMYFTWQVEVQIINFREFGISDRMHVLLWYREGDNLSVLEPLVEKYPEVKFFLYKDQGAHVSTYIPVIRPHILCLHYATHAELLKGKPIFYHDSDIIFNFLPDFDKLLSDDVCWQSNTSSYLDYEYLRNKEKQGNIPEEEAIKILASIGGIDVETIKSYKGKTGGAQCLLKGVDANFWKDVEKTSIDIIREFSYAFPTSINRKYFKSEDEGFQSWCADMWALNFALWKRGIKSDVTQELEFSWATDSIDTYKLKPIYHNAGSTGQDPGVFFKGAFHVKAPYNEDFSVIDPKRASFMYVEAIKKVK